MSFFGNNRQRQAWIFVTYLVAVVVVFGVLFGVSVYLQTSADRSFALPSFLTRRASHDTDVATPPESTVPDAVKTDARLAPQRVVYRPVKNDLAEDLVLPSATSGVVLDVDSGIILWEKNATERRSIASLTKLVTAMIVIDRVQDLDAYVTIPADVTTIEGTKVGCPTSVICTSARLVPGEEVRVRDLLMATLMFSANDAATALGVFVAGSEEEFAVLMNARMKELSASNTHFCRPSGLELDGDEQACYSSAYDVARVMAHLLRHDKYDVLWDIMRTPQATFTSRDGTVTHDVDNTYRLLGQMDNLLGGKTGFTPRAGYCLSLASHDATRTHRIVAVVLDDPQRFTSVEAMSAWAFASFAWQ